ncbi:hypothetical protein ACE6H2_014853 [Prunus campanulata]
MEKVKHIGSEYNNIKISSRDVVIGCKTTMFQLNTDYSTDRVDYDGYVYFNEKGKPKYVKLIYVAKSEDYAEHTYDFTHSVRVSNILYPWLFGFCLHEFGQGDRSLFSYEVSMKKVFWGLCNKKYEMSLFSLCKSVDNGEIKDEKANMKDNNRCLSEYWRYTIREILVTISYTYAANLYHGGLDSKSSYVFLNGELS